MSKFRTFVFPSRSLPAAALSSLTMLLFTVISLLSACGGYGTAAGDPPGTESHTSLSDVSTTVGTPTGPTADPPPAVESTQGVPPETSGPEVSGEGGSSAPAGVPEEELRAYYEDLIATLQKQLLDERLDRYVAEHDYKTQLAELRRQLALRPTESVSGETQPVSAPPETSTPESSPSAAQDFRYAVVDHGVTIYGYLGGAQEVTVPATIDGYPVTAVADSAFQNSRVTSVLLPDTVTAIGWFAFSGCTSLESVTLPASVQSIAYAAFDHCPSLVVRCPRDSYAARWADSYGLRVQYT